MKKPLYKFRQSYYKLHNKLFLWPFIILVVASTTNAIISMNDIQHKMGAGSVIQSLLTICIIIFFLGGMIYASLSGRPSALVDLLVFKEHLTIKSRFSFAVTPKPDATISADSITNIQAHPDINCELPHSNSWNPGTRGSGDWEGWITYVATDSVKSSEIAVETTEGKYLIGCNDPVDVAKKLNELYASQIQKHDK